MALLGTQTGDIDDIVGDCLRIHGIIPHRADQAPQVTVARTARQ